MNEFGRNLKERLDILGMSTSSLAKSINQTPQSISHYIYGVRTPDIYVVRKIAKVLDCSTDELIP